MDCPTSEEVSPDYHLQSSAATCGRIVMKPEYRLGVQYSKHSSYNTVDICIPHKNPEVEESNKVWVLFIHGGAWRDPTKQSAIFTTSQAHLLASPAISHISAFASINYRLSPYTSRGAPSVPSTKDAASNDDDAARTAMHPDHINDVLDAIAYLQSHYGFGSRYILSGHSAGATLALQACMSRAWSVAGPGEGEARDVVPPVCVLGLEGIYNVPALVEYHAGQAVYREFITSAFGDRWRDGVDVWGAASPTAGEYQETWKEGRVCVLAHSREDELVEWEQVELMRGALVRGGWSEGGGHGSRQLEMLELRGRHDEVWSDLKEVARAIEFAVQKVVALS